jgi:chromosome segregation ATPase
LRESQDRQAAILRKIADKERQMHGGGGGAAGSHNTAATAAGSGTTGLAPAFPSFAPLAPTSASPFAHSLSHTTTLPNYQPHGATSTGPLAAALSPTRSVFLPQPQAQPTPSMLNYSFNAHQQQQQQQQPFQSAQRNMALRFGLVNGGPNGTGSGGIGGGTGTGGSLGDFLNSTVGLPSPSPSSSPFGGLDFSAAEERAAMLHLGDEEGAALLRVRQLASQLRHAKSEMARKDVTMANLTQQVAEMSRAAAEHATQKAAWDARETQHALRENEYTQQVAELQATVQSLTATEASLRAGQLALHKDKLTLERQATVTLGDLEARVQTLTAEAEAAKAAQEKAVYEAAVSARELARVQQAFSAFESQQLDIAQAVEERFASIRAGEERDKASAANLNATLQRTRQELAERDEQLEARENELQVSSRAKVAAQALAESVQRELDEVLAERERLRLLSEQVPQLREQVRQLAEAQQALRASQVQVSSLEAQLSSSSAALATTSAETQALKQLQVELDKQVSEARERLGSVVGPGGELEAARVRANVAEEELAREQERVGALTAALDAASRSEASLQANLDSFNTYATVQLNNVHKLLEAGMTAPTPSPPTETSSSLASPLSPRAVQSHSAAAMRESQALEAEWGGLSPPAAVKEAVRSAGSSLRAAVQAALADVAHLRSTGSSLSTRLGSAETELRARATEVAELEDTLSKQREHFASASESMAREHAAAVEALERLGEELGNQREANTQLNAQNESLITELEQRATTVRLWAVEMEGLARSMAHVDVDASFVASSSSAERSSPNKKPSSSPGRKTKATIAGLAEVDAGRSLLGASAPLSVSEHWPSIAATFSSIQNAVAARSRALVSELADCTRSRSQQRHDISRLSEELAAVGAQLAQVTESSQRAARQAAQVLADSEAQRLEDASRQSEESRSRERELQTSYEQIVAQLQEAQRRSTGEVIELTRRGHNLLVAVRLLFKALKPLQVRAGELGIQKSLMIRLLRRAEAESSDARQLMEAMTGVVAPVGVRAIQPLQRARRALFRAGVIAVLAARRMREGARRRDHLGLLAPVRGGGRDDNDDDVLSLLDNTCLSADANLPPGLDDSTLASSAQSFVALMAHLEPATPESALGKTHRHYYSARDNAPLLARLSGSSSSRYRSHNSSGGTDDAAAVTPIGVIRRVALGMATRSKQLERDLSVATTDAWAAREEARTIVADLQATHAQLVAVAEEQLASERSRVQALDAEVRALQQGLREAQESLSECHATRQSMVTRSEFEGMRQAKEDQVRLVRDLEAQLSTLQSSQRSEREKAALESSLTREAMEAKLEHFKRRLMDATREQTELQQSMQRKTNELAAAQRATKEAEERQVDAARNIENLQAKLGAASERIKVLEVELGEHRHFSHKLKSAALGLESSRAHADAQVAHLSAELRERERELHKSQELVRTLAAATHAATTELDSQIVYTKGIARRAGLATMPTPQQQHQPPPPTPQQQYYSSYGSSAVPPASVSRSGGGYSHLPSPSPSLSAMELGGASTAAPQMQQQQQGAPTIRLRHHPGGRLSMDMTHAGGGDGQNDFVQLTNTAAPSSAAGSPSRAATGAGLLRFDDLPAVPSSAASAPNGGSGGGAHDGRGGVRSSSPIDASIRSEAPPARVQRD